KKQEEALIHLENEIKRADAMLNNQNFIAKAPEKKVNQEKEKRESYKLQKENVLKRIEELKKHV
ncbi:MAG: hypothetical protein ACOCUE_05220, partial [Candidatus Izemoplasmataceae bacterium]